MAMWPPISDGLMSSQESVEDYHLQPPPKRSRCDNGDKQNGVNKPLADWEAWDCHRVADELHEAGLGEFSEKFREENIVGSVLSKVNTETLQRLGISKVGDQLRVSKFIDDVTNVVLKESQPDMRKVFNDPIHGHIDIHPLCIKIIDTPQFQRLRFLKQLGSCYFVYPGATHNRFEHSLGVCHLAGRLVRALQRRQPDLKITDKDVLCVEIAGLCHDLGHGPFSHLFDGKVIPYLRPDRKWKHEEASGEMLDFLIKENNLLEEFHVFGLDEQDIVFIKEQVLGPHHGSLEWAYKGRSKDKSFLYEIVANKRNGIDVDKWDYFARDCHMLGIRNNFDHTRFIQFARVCDVDGCLQICSRDKEVGNLYDMFHTRSTLHRRAYQHKAVNIIDTMITEAIIKANDYITFADRDGKIYRMSESIESMFVYSQLTDYIFFQILHSKEPELAESREILNNILCRKLYKCVGQTQLKSDQVVKGDDVNKLKEEVLKCIDDDERQCSGIKSDDFAVHLVYLDYGMKDKNPIDNVRFYSKEQSNIATRVRKNQVSQMLPETFSEQCIRIHCKKQDPRTLEMLKKAFQAFCENKGFPTPKESNALELTPVQKSSPASNGGEKDVTPGSAGKFKSRLSF